MDDVSPSPAATRLSSRKMEICSYQHTEFACRHFPAPPTLTLGAEIGAPGRRVLHTYPHAIPFSMIMTNPNLSTHLKIQANSTCVLFPSEMFAFILLGVFVSSIVLQTLTSFIMHNTFVTASSSLSS